MGEAASETRPGLVTSEVFTFFSTIRIIYAHLRKRKGENANSRKESIKPPMILPAGTSHHSHSGASPPAPLRAHCPKSSPSPWVALWLTPFYPLCLPLHPQPGLFLVRDLRLFYKNWDMVFNWTLLFDHLSRNSQYFPRLLWTPTCFPPRGDLTLFSGKGHLLPLILLFLQHREWCLRYLKYL